ncbi:MAG: hypothetical protein QW702_06645 [Candidatus Bathyarchaeia archaeon]
MSLSHDELAEFLSRVILQKFRHLFGNVFISSISMDFPKPDFIYVPYEMRNIQEIERYLGQTTLTGERLPLPVSFEVKTPYVFKHEYITGIGQAISYNSVFPLSYLVIPDFNMEKFEVLDFVKEIVETNNLNIGLFSYKMENPKEIELIKEASIVKTQAKRIKESVKGIRRSYSYWRETMPEEVFEALRISKELESAQEPYILDEVLMRLWNEVLSRRFPKTTRKSSFLLNYKLFLIQNALLDATGRLTAIGRHTLTLGERFGKESETFREIITYVMLKYGGHYILLAKIYEEQRQMSNEQLSSWETWINEIARKLREHDYYISKDDFRTDLPRMPFAYDRYFCGIAESRFIKGRGISINFPKIITILDKGSKLFSAIESTLSF